MAAAGVGEASFPLSVSPLHFCVRHAGQSLSFILSPSRPVRETVTGGPTSQGWINGSSGTRFAWSGTPANSTTGWGSVEHENPNLNIQSELEHTVPSRGSWSLLTLRVWLSASGKLRFVRIGVRGVSISAFEDFGDTTWRWADLTWKECGLLCILGRRDLLRIHESAIYNAFFNLRTHSWTTVAARKSQSFQLDEILGS